MEKFAKKRIIANQISDSDKGIKISTLIKLIDDNDLAKTLLGLMDIDSIKDEFIPIAGAQTLVHIQKTIKDTYKKDDLKSSLNNISLYAKDEFTINFNDLKSSDYLQGLKLKNIATIPIYSARREFFSNLYQMDKYAGRLIDAGQKGIVEENLKMIKAVHTVSKRYRLLHDKAEDIFYLRAIISMKNYHDYDNNVAVVMGLLALHQEIKKTGIIYSLKFCEYNESFIKMCFDSTDINDLASIGRVKNLVEISNDEIKREALKFTGVCSIMFGGPENTNNELFIRPQEVKSKIIAIKHNQVPETALKEFGNIDKAQEVHAQIFDDISKIAKIKKPEQIKFLVRKKVENAKNDEVKRYKQSILNELNNSVSNIIQLLTMFSKIELLASEDIEASDYLKFVIYQALIENK
jgi:hypothetical protein